MTRTSRPCASSAAKPPRCRRLASKRGKFKRRPSTSGACDNPKWVKAKPKGKKRKHRFVLKLKGRRKLGFGTYVVYSRLTLRSGGQEVGFTRKDRNRLEFTLRKGG